MSDEQSLPELASHYGPRGPVAAANEWISLVLSGNLRAAWPKTDATLRLVLAQAWLWANRERPDVEPFDLDDGAQSLAGLTFDHDLWSCSKRRRPKNFSRRGRTSTTTIGAPPEKLDRSRARSTLQHARYAYVGRVYDLIGGAPDLERNPHPHG
jgi:hypothetical protein